MKSPVNLHRLKRIFCLHRDCWLYVWAGGEATTCHRCGKEWLR